MRADEASDAHYARAEEALRRALELNPDLPIAHHFITIVELETGHARAALVRLLEQVRSHPADPELFAGLVQACRYVGLDRPAIAAYEHASRLDPNVRTAVSHAYFAIGEFGRVIETDLEDPPIISALAKDRLGRRTEAIADLARLRGAGGIPMLFRLIIDATVALLEGRQAEALPASDRMMARWPLRDPCATYYLARTLAAAGHPRALEIFRRSVEGGFHSVEMYRADPWLDPLRANPAFQQVLALAEARHREAAATFVSAGGERLLGAAGA